MLLVPVRRETDWSAHHNVNSPNAVIMDGKFESHSNKHDESKVNRLTLQREPEVTRKRRDPGSPNPAIVSVR